MKKQSGTFTIYISLLILAIQIPNGSLWSCGPVLQADESRFALFRNGLDGKKGLKPFYYSERLFNLAEEAPDTTDRVINCKEWAAFTNNFAKEKDIYTIQYQTTPENFQIGYIENFKGFTGNSFIEWLQKKENKPALDYMIMAKRNEDAQSAGRDPWDTSRISNEIMFTDVAEFSLKQILSIKNPFLKERYSFQAIKAFYYKPGNKNADRNSISRIYEEQLENKKTIVASWAAVYYANVQTDKNKRALYLLKTFDASDEKKMYCVQQLNIVDLADLAKVNSDPYIRMLIHTIRAVKNKGKALEDIKEIIKYDAGSRYLPLLLSREINKLENWLWSPEMLEFSCNYREELGNDYSGKQLRELRKQDEAYLMKLLSLLENIQSLSKDQKSFNQLALLHLYNMNHDNVKALKLWDKLPVFANPVKETQRLIEKIITISQAAKITEPGTQRELAAIISKLKKLNPVFTLQLRHNYFIWDEHQQENEHNDDLSELYIILSKAFKKQGDLLSAGLLFTKANITVNQYDGYAVETNNYNDSSAVYKKIAWFDRYASAADVAKLLKLKHTKNKSAFQQLIVPDDWAPDDFYRDLQGTILFRQKKYVEALEAFNSINPDFWEKNYKYKSWLPSTSVKYIEELSPAEKKIAVKYKSCSKKLIAAEIVELQNAINTTKNDSIKAILNYQLANALFNTSYNGKAWMMFSYGKSIGEDGTDSICDNYYWSWYNFNPNGVTFRNDYYLCKTAIATYKKALELTRDKELAAKCLFALAICDRISKGNNLNQYWNNEKNKGYHSPYLVTLATKYELTAFFKETAVTCPDIKDY